jgi:endonuclease-8
MPEGHTLHRLARLHSRRYTGREVKVSSPQGRFAADAAKLDGRRFAGAEAYGKHLFHDYGPHGVVHVHLGLYGSFAEFELPEPAPIGQVRMRIVGPTHATDLRGPNQCELLSRAEVDTITARLGPDPLRPDADPQPAVEKISSSRAPIAALLMDQQILAGVGNVYRAEVLFRLQIDPMLPGGALGRTRAGELWADLVGLMQHGVRTGSIDTVRPEHLPEAMGRSPREDRHGGEVYVYRRAGMPCHICGTAVAMTELLARKLYWCPHCQG